MLTGGVEITAVSGAGDQVKPSRLHGGEVVGGIHSVNTEGHGGVIPEQRAA